jgi:hypothetical protein
MAAERTSYDRIPRRIKSGNTFAMPQSPTKAEMKAYNKARDEIAAGVVLLQKRIRQPKPVRD